MRVLYGSSDMKPGRGRRQQKTDAGLVEVTDGDEKQETQNLEIKAIRG